MEVRFRTAKFEKTCSTLKSLRREYGPRMADVIARRLTELEAAVALSDIRALPQARAHELRGDRDEQISLDLIHPRRLILEVGDEPVPRMADGGLHWEAITSVVVVGIADTHR